MAGAADAVPAVALLPLNWLSWMCVLALEDHHAGEPHKREETVSRLQ